MDKILISGVEVEALVGVYEWERAGKQPLRVDLDLAFDNRKAASRDVVAATVDYERVVVALRECIGGREDQLIETLAEHCTRMLLQEFPILQVRLRISKPGAAHALGCSDIAVEIVRQREAS